ncbi:MAG: phosphoglycerate dehydrogenase-like oxidoreductase [Haloplasmataceae bacterium]|jgi:phosphoglycerate dehydrogenase-like enzyme|nr:phosphoglycerate dehydrogenase-like oxidoreductase [Haloplasmataceae bacterium]
MRILIRYGKRNEYLHQKVSTLKMKYPHIDISIDHESEYNNLENVDLLVTNSIISKAEIDSSNILKYLIIPFTGVNQLPLDELDQKGIKVINSHINSRYVAEKAIALALALLGKIVELDNNLRIGNWKHSTWTSIYEMKCGIIGMGEIGKKIINHLIPFECQINTLERYKNKLQSNFNYYESIKDVCLNSDIVFVSLPLTNETKNIINGDILYSMKDKYIINVGRGDVIEEEALYNALKNNILKGAGLDVWYQYPQSGSVTYPSKFPFHEFKNIVISPHCGGGASRCRSEEIDGVMEKIEAFIQGEEINNVINTTKKY